MVKERFKKEYRVPALDERLTKSRILQEVKSMNRVRKSGVLAPAVYLCDVAERKIFMEYLGDETKTLKDFIRGLGGNMSHPIMPLLAEKIAENLANLHKGDNIHGDLTTSNMMLKPKGWQGAFSIEKQ